MTVTTADTISTFSGPGAGPFVYTFFVWDETDIKVVKLSAAQVETVLDLDDDYTIDLDAKSVTLDVALITGEKVSVIRSIANRQGIRPRKNAPHYLEVHEEAWDRVSMRQQTRQEVLDRTLKRAISSPLSATYAAAQWEKRPVLIASGSSSAGSIVFANPVTLSYDLIRIDLEYSGAMTALIGLFVWDGGPTSTDTAYAVEMFESVSGATSAQSEPAGGFFAIHDKSIGADSKLSASVWFHHPTGIGYGSASWRGDPAGNLASHSRFHFWYGKPASEEFTSLNFNDLGGGPVGNAKVWGIPKT